VRIFLKKVIANRGETVQLSAAGQDDRHSSVGNVPEYRRNGRFYPLKVKKKRAEAGANSK